MVILSSEDEDGDFGSVQVIERRLRRPIIPFPIDLGAIAELGKPPGLDPLNYVPNCFERRLRPLNRLDQPEKGQRRTLRLLYKSL